MPRLKIPCFTVILYRDSNFKFILEREKGAAESGTGIAGEALSFSISSVSNIIELSGQGMDTACLTWYSCLMTELEKIEFKTRIRQAWPKQRLDQLGPLQVRLMSQFVGEDGHKKGDLLTVEELSNLLIQIEEYYPEALIPSSGLLRR